MGTYTCETCNYSVDLLFNYNKHLLTKKHIAKSSGVIPFIESTDFTRNNNAMFKCNYCKKICKTNHNKSRHINGCRQKYNDKMNALKVIEDHELTIKRLEQEKDQLRLEKAQEQQQLVLSKDYISTVVQVVKECIGELTPTQNITNNIINNNNYNNVNNNNNKNCFNLNYIKQNFTNPISLEDCLSTPLSEIEKYNITKNNPTVGCEYLIRTRCIDEFDVAKRPIHSIDRSRNKFAVFCDDVEKNKNWITQDGDEITKKFIPMIRAQYEEKYNDHNFNASKIAEGLDYLHTKGNKKIVKSIGKMTSIKNSMSRSGNKKKKANTKKIEDPDDLDVDSDELNEVHDKIMRSRKNK
jgi:hypothetical protein